jgi:hypothetical protein
MAGPSRLCALSPPRGTPARSHPAGSLPPTTTDAPPRDPEEPGRRRHPSHSDNCATAPSYASRQCTRRRLQGARTARAPRRRPPRWPGRAAPTGPAGGRCGCGPGRRACSPPRRAGAQAQDTSPRSVSGSPCLLPRQGSSHAEGAPQLWRPHRVGSCARREDCARSYISEVNNSRWCAWSPSGSTQRADLAAMTSPPRDADRHP